MFWITFLHEIFLQLASFYQNSQAAFGRWNPKESFDHCIFTRNAFGRQYTHREWRLTSPSNVEFSIFVMRLFSKFLKNINIKNNLYLHSGNMNYVLYNVNCAYEWNDVNLFSNICSNVLQHCLSIIYILPAKFR